MTFHKGCELEFEYVFGKLLGHTVEVMRFDDGETVGNEICDITQNRAQKCWDKYKDYFNTFDGILVTDTSPTSRPFLQNNWSKLLIIWVTNRFDYHVEDDQDYYNLLRDIPNRKNVYILGNTRIENVYSKYIKNVDITDRIIKIMGKNVISDGMYKKHTENDEPIFFAPAYQNETQFMNLAAKLNELGIKNNNAQRFKSHISELLAYKGIICLPYAWCTLTFFEVMQLGIIYFVPSLSFILRLLQNHTYWFQPPYIRNEEILRLSEWYCDEHKDLLVYFDSWEDLAEKVKTTDYEAQTKKILLFARLHSARVLLQWNEVFEDYKKQLPPIVSVNNIKYIITNKHDTIQNTLFNGHQWSDETIRVVKKFITEFKLTHFVNIGSHIGTVCIPISKHIKKVTAIEAYPSNYSHLVQNIELNNITNIDHYNFAVGNTEDKIYFITNQHERTITNSGGMHVFLESDIAENRRSASLCDRKVTNNMYRFDQLDIDDFQIMVIDIEGGEYDFLQGAREKILKNKPILIIEIWNNEKRKMENMATTYEFIVEYIEKMGYRLLPEVPGCDPIFVPLLK